MRAYLARRANLLGFWYTEPDHPSLWPALACFGLCLVFAAWMGC